MDTVHPCQSWFWTISGDGYCDTCGERNAGKRIAYEPYLRIELCQACAFDRRVAQECRGSKDRALVGGS